MHGPHPSSWGTRWRKPGPMFRRRDPGSPDPAGRPGASTGPATGPAASEAQPSELLGVALPFLGDLHVQVQVDPGAHQRLDAVAGPGADLAQPRSGTPDDDGLLGGAFDEEVHVDVQQRVVLWAALAGNDLLDHDGQGVRQLVAHALEG